MSVTSGQSVTVTFTTRHPVTGMGTDADFAPSGIVNVNGLANAATVTVTNLGTGEYKAAVTLPSLAVGDGVDLRIIATVGGVADKAIVWRERCDATVNSRSTYAGGAVASITDPSNIVVGGPIVVVNNMVQSDVQMVLQSADAALGLQMAGDKFKADEEFDATLTPASIAAVQADILAAINALNQSASRRIVLQVITQMERPETGSTNFEIELRTYDGDGAAVNADTTPTITPTGLTTGSLAANLGSVSNPSTGVYRATYNVEATDTLEQIRFVASATIASSTFAMTAYSLVADFIAATWTTADRALLQNASDDTDTLVSRLTAQRALNLDYLDAAVSDIPTLAEFNARTLVAASYALETTSQLIHAKTGQLFFSGSPGSTRVLADANINVDQDDVDAIAEGVAELVDTHGNGDIAVDHDYGGTDELQILEIGTEDPMDDALITAFFDGTVNGQTRTGSDGRWIAPLMLDAGSYTLVISKAGEQVKSVDLVVEA